MLVTEFEKQKFANIMFREFYFLSKVAKLNSVFSFIT